MRAHSGGGRGCPSSAQSPPPPSLLGRTASGQQSYCRATSASGGSGERHLSVTGHRKDGQEGTAGRIPRGAPEEHDSVCEHLAAGLEGRFHARLHAWRVGGRQRVVLRSVGRPAHRRCRFSARCARGWWRSADARAGSCCPWEDGHWKRSGDCGQERRKGSESEAGEAHLVKDDAPEPGSAESLPVNDADVLDGDVRHGELAVAALRGGWAAGAEGR